MRIIGLDFGEKRTGIAVTDPLKIIATHHKTVETRELLAYLKHYIGLEDVEGFVLGKPLNLRNELNDIYKRIVPFKKELKKAFPNLYIEEIDERFSSKIAFQSIVLSGVNKKKRRDKKQVDMVSAVILLQNYLDLKKRMT